MVQLCVWAVHGASVCASLSMCRHCIERVCVHGQCRECLCAGNAGEADAGLASPLEVYQGLAADGYQVSYRRVPLSRERTPEAADLDVLHQQLMTQPVGMCLWFASLYQPCCILQEG